MNFVVEPEKKIPIYAQEDVVVCGGGVAGIGAAIAAARSGASALLIERNNGLGGDASVAGSALLYQNAKDARGILRELIDRMVEMNGVVTDFRTDYPPHNLGSGPGVDFVVYEPETFKQVALDMLEEAGVKLLLYTQFSAPIMQGNKTIGVFVENKSGRQAILSKVVLDCTGDADVAARAGVPCVLGRETDNKIRPVTLYFRVGNVDFKRLKAFAENHADEVPGGGKGVDLERGVVVLNGFNKMVKEAVTLGELDPSVEFYVRFDNLIAGNSCRINTTRVYDINPTNGEDLTRAELMARKQIQQIMKFLRAKIDGFESAVVLETAAHLGIRESRHIVGDYVLSPEDFAKKFDDAIWAKKTLWGPGTDMHDPDGPAGDLDRFLGPAWTDRHDFQIPYRCLVPKDIEGLLVAGRCISAIGSMRWNTRSIQACLYTGQVVGTAAALAAEDDVLPRNIDVKTLQSSLLEQGFLPSDVS
jgi:hypothetical protein